MAGVPDLAARLNRLFEVSRQPHGSRWTLAAASSALTAAGVPVSDIYLGRLKSGEKANPSAQLLHAIAELFGVPLEYFFDEEKSRAVDKQLELLSAVQDQRVRAILARSAGVSDGGLEAVLNVLNHVRTVEGVTDVPSN